VSFSRLLLAGASSKKYIVGNNGKDRVIVSPKFLNPGPGREAFEGEVILCFQIDEESEGDGQVAHSLGFQGDDSRCDGLIFYSQDGESEKIICLVEMKSTNLGDADEQIIQSKTHIKNLLVRECHALPQECREDCENQINSIKWKACVFHHGSSPLDIQAILKRLKSSGFKDVRDFTRADNDARGLLTGEVSAKGLAKKVRGDNRRHSR